MLLLFTGMLVTEAVVSLLTRRLRCLVGAAMSAREVSQEMVSTYHGKQATYCAKLSEREKALLQYGQR